VRNEKFSVFLIRYYSYSNLWQQLKMKRVIFLVIILTTLVCTPFFAQESENVNDKLRAALISLDSKDYEKAEMLINDYLLLFPNDEFAFNGLGIIKYRQGEIDKAIELFDKSIALKPDFINAHENRANAKVDRGDVLGALKDINFAINQDSTLSSTYINRGRIQLINKDTISAFNDFDKGIKLGSIAPQAYTNRGICYWYQKKLDLALADLQYAISQHPNYGYAYANYGIVQIEGLNDIVSANVSLQKAYNLGLRDNGIIFRIGYTNQLLGKLDEAFFYYSLFIKTDPTDSEAFYNRGTIIAHQKKYDLALQDFGISLKLEPKNTGVLTNRALLVYEPTGEFNKAISDMQNVIKQKENLNLNPAIAYNNLGYLQLKNQELVIALNNIKRSIELDSTNSYAYKNLALIGIESGDLSSACNATQKAIDLGFIENYGNEILAIKENACRKDKK
jgi:tetratricopeptide (TPR) repeat protein|tara:strand:+ start:2789 stop:4138 length:1350 start_codon:yes stop_codon:yes gene_type:complete